MLNNISLIGRLTSDPEQKQTPSGATVTSFTLAVPRAYVKQGEERQADFIDVVAWQNTAIFICKYFSKGQMMAVVGKLQTRTYEDKNGRKRKSVEVVADNVFFTESKGQTSSIDVSPDPIKESEGFDTITDDEDLPF